MNKLSKGLLNKFPDARGKFPEYKICCPFCDENEYRFGVNVVKPTAHCFKCGETLNGKQLAELFGISSRRWYEPNDFRSLDTILEGVNPAPRIVSAKTNHIQLDAVPMSGILNTDLEEEFFELYAAAYGYLEHRHFDPVELAREYGLLLPRRHSRERDRLILPVFEGGKLVYYQARTLTRSRIKYLNPSTEQCPLGKSHFVFNLEKASEYEEIVVCEGIFSALSVGPQAVAIFGKELSMHQARKISRAGRPVTIMLDPGAKAWAEKTAAILAKRIPVRIAELEDGDPNEVPRSVISESLRSAKGFSLSDYEVDSLFS